MQEEPVCSCDTNRCNLVRRPKDENGIPGKWVYQVKRKTDGSLEKYKARYVAKNFKKIEGIDYFAPTGKPETIRLTLRQMDVKSAFLHPEIQEELNLEQPMGFEKLDSSCKKLVCILNRSVFGLKQAPKNWNQELASFLNKQNFVRGKNDYCLFSKNENDKCFFVWSWVDDVVTTGSTSQDVEKLIKALETKFRMVEQGKIECFFGMQVSEDSEITLDQKNTCWNCHKKFSMQDSNPSKTLAENNRKLMKATEDEKLVEKTL